VVQNSHAGYYPGAVPLTIKLLFSAGRQESFTARRPWAAGGVDKRIDTIGVAMRLGGGVADLEDLELAYAPPYSSAKDPVNMAGFTAGNLLRGPGALRPWDVKSDDNTVFLDVREDAELMAFTCPALSTSPWASWRPHD
jgi:hypothetical protein